MLKDLLKKELRQLWLGPKTLGASEPPAYGQTPAWQVRKGRADDNTASGKGNGSSTWPTSRDVLATARAASGM
jgi:hypothetical protein